MGLFLGQAFAATGSVDHSWEHKLEGPLLLADQIVQKVYSDETKPFRHNGITVTDYLKKLEVTFPEVRPGCFQPDILKWVVSSTIYVRSKTIEGPNGKTMKNPRWLEIGHFGCRDADKEFNTWEGTYYHETEHFQARDQMLKDFWKELRAALPEHCSPSAKDAEKYLVGLINVFQDEAVKADSEQRAESLEAKWYLKQFEKTSRKKCENDFPYLKLAFPKAKLKVEGQKIHMANTGDAYTGMQKGSLTVLLSRLSNTNHYFQFGSYLAKETLEAGKKVRYEYRLNGQLKHKVWLDETGKIVTKAWADENGHLGKPVQFVERTTSQTSLPLVTIIDTGYEDFDEDGHGTFVQNIVREVSGLKDEQILAIKATSNLDQTLWDGLAVSQGTIVNLSIGQGIDNTNPPKKEDIEKTCKLIKELSHKKLIVMGAGNNGSQQEKAPFYPASCPWEEKDSVLVVGSFDQLNKTNADFGRTTSNWSTMLIHTAVAGGTFSSFYPGKTKAIRGGTSFSTAYISGIAAKLKKANDLLTPSQVKQAILNMCSKDENAAPYVKDGCLIKRF